VLCFVSENFIHSRHCLAEFKEAFDLGKPGRHIVMKLHQFVFTSNDQELESEINLLETFTKTHTHIDWQEDTWRQRVLYSMPTQRMGQVAEPGVNGALVESKNEPLLSSIST